MRETHTAFIDSQHNITKEAPVATKSIIITFPLYSHVASAAIHAHPQSPHFQETCPNNIKGRGPPNPHKPLPGVHEEDINLSSSSSSMTDPIMRCHRRLAFTSSYQRMVLFPCMCELTSRDVFLEKQPDAELRNTEDQMTIFAPCRTFNQYDHSVSPKNGT